MTATHKLRNVERRWTPVSTVAQPPEKDSSLIYKHFASQTSDVMIILQHGGYQRLVGLAFVGAIGMTFLVLACALPSYNNWWPLFVVIFYILAPLPTVISRRYIDDMASSSACQELAIFLTAGIIISAFGLPIVLARAPSSAPTIEPGACGFIVSGNVVVFLTILGFFMAFENDDIDYSMW